MNSKGLVISLDALIALMVFLVFFSLSATYLDSVKFEAKNSLLLKSSAMDSLIVLEKSGALEEAVKKNKVNLIRQFINKLPNSLCVEVSVFSENDFDDSLMSVLRQGCKKNFVDSATFNRAFVVRNDFSVDFYLARLTVWQRVN